jgi:hypothetical protein
MATVVFAVVLALSEVAVGVTVIVTVAVAVEPLPSVAVYSKLAVPEKPAAGVKTGLPPPRVTVPLTGVPTAVMARADPASFPVRVAPASVTGVFAVMLAASGVAVGVTVTATVAVVVVPLASVAV